jgi:hypothetical protein
MLHLKIKEFDQFRNWMNHLIEKHDNKQSHYDPINHDNHLVDRKVSELELL